MIPLFVPGRSPLHRLPAGPKLAGLAIAAVAISLGARTPVGAGVAAGVVLLAFALGGLGPRAALRQVWAVRWLVAVLAVSQLVFLTPGLALVNSTRVAAVVLLAGVLTRTTRAEDVVEAIRRGLAPLRPLGVDPWRVAFLLSLTIALVPVVAGFAHRIREAQRARGVRLGPRAVVTLLVLALRHADEVADALTARGIA